MGRYDYCRGNIWNHYWKYGSSSPLWWHCTYSKQLFLSTATPQQNDVNRRTANLAVWCIMEAHLEVPQASEPPLNLKTLLWRGRDAEQGIKKTRCHVLKQGGRLSGKERQKTTVVSERRYCAACLCQQEWLKYTPMNMQFLYEEFDNKGPTTSFLMRLDCLCFRVCVCVCVCVFTDWQVSTTLSYLNLWLCLIEELELV